MKIPAHVAIIMDGNGRWAKSRGLLRAEGHKKGLETAENIIDFCLEKGIKYLSLFVFSTENWKRPQAEVSVLFGLAEKYLDNFQSFCQKGVRVVISGEKTDLPKSLVTKLTQVEEKTAAFSAICVNLCINYGGRADVVQAAQKLAKEGKKITEKSLAENLYNAFLPAPDVIIRTGGEMRLSNFLLFQGAYAELFFTNTLWPDFDRTEFVEILQEYAKRKRNFGGLSD